MAGRLSDRIGPRPFVTGGMVVAHRARSCCFSRMGVHATFWGAAPGDAPRRRRHGDRDGADDGRGDGSVRPDKAGVGSAVLNSMRQVGGSLGIAIMGAIVAATASRGGRDPADFLHGFHHALETGAIITLAGAVIAWLTLADVKPREHAAPATETA